MNPTAVYYANRANAHFNLAVFAQAEADAEKAVEIDPSYMKAHWRLAEICRCTGRQNEALNHYKEANKLEPKNRKIAEQLISVANLIRS